MLWCSACGAICPEKCISFIPDKLGFLYPIVDEVRCINCGLCEKVCPNLKEILSEITATPETYIAVGKDDKIRRKSSSGGAFSLIAQNVILQGGVVFGAAFDELCHVVKHVAVETVDGLDLLRGAKYVQSQICDAYAEAKSYLEQKRVVLFAGTPCQISGLKAFLQKDYDNLLLLDIACHGVPSPAVWDSYISYLEKRYCGKSVNVSFRDKRNGWRSYILRVTFENGSSYSNGYSTDLYMRGFLHNYYLRPSCFECRHKGVQRESDITLADCWGVENFCSELDDNMGTSLIFVSSSKGQAVIKSILGEMKYKYIDVDHVLKYNPSIVRSSERNSKYDEFYDSFLRLPVDRLLRKYCAVSMRQRIIRKIRAIIGK